MTNSTGSTEHEILATSTTPVQSADDPLYVSKNEAIGNAIVTQPLIGAENFIAWKKSMEVALGVKMKLGFVRGDFPRPTDLYQLARWERCNNVIFSWIINSVSKEIGATLIHAYDCISAWTDLQERFGGSNDSSLFSIQQEISEMMQGDMSIAIYYGKLIKLWGDEDSLIERQVCDLGTKCKATKCFDSRKMKDRIMKFLMGLNEAYTAVRSQILLMEPFPTLREVYKMLISEETTRKSKKPVVAEISALYANQNSSTPGGNSKQGMSRNNYSGGANNKGRRPFCTNCNIQGHTRETCYKLVGYPANHKSQKAPNQVNRFQKSSINAVASDAGTKDASANNPSSQGENSNHMSSVQFTNDQLNKLFKLLNQPINEQESTQHMAGITCLTSFKADSDVSILDSGATDHITPYSSLLSGITLLSDPQHVLMPNGDKVVVKFTGNCALNEHLVLKNVLLIPEIRFNLISVAKLVTDSGSSVAFTNNGCVVQDQKGQTVATGEPLNGLYQLRLKASRLIASKNCFISHKKNSATFLWHKRLGHVPFRKLVNYFKSSIPDLNSISCNVDELHCDVCPQARQCRLPFPNSISVSSDLFDLLHADVWGPYRVPTLNGAKYFLTLVEDKSKCIWTFLMSNKAETTGHLINFYKMVQTQFGKNIKVLRSDNGGEFLCSKLDNFLADKGCLHHTSCSYTPQQNGRVERRHKHILEVARSLKIQSNMPECFWGESVLTATYIINRMPSVVLQGKSPYKVLFGTKPSYSHMRVFGSKCYVTNIQPNKSKFDPRAHICAFLGYPFGQKGYKVFDLHTHSIFVSRDICFVEDEFPFKVPDPVIESSSIPFPAFQGDDNLTDDDEHEYPAQNEVAPVIQPSNIVTEIQTNTDDSDTVIHHSNMNNEQRTSLRKSTRVRKPSTRLKDFICNNITSASEYPITSQVNYSKCSPSFQHYALQIISDTEPTSYTQASKYDCWIQAMQTEIKALQDNHTWEITDLPYGKNAVGCKWVFKIKRKSDGSIERYKARLVAKCFTQLEGLDYHETFAPVVKMNTVRTLLAVAISKGWPLYQMDVNNAFLHGILDEEVYMSLPPGFYKSDKAKGRVCKLHKSLYGLKQASRQWFSKFSEALISYGFQPSLNDYSLFTYTTQKDYIALLVYVDDIIITGTSQLLIDQIKQFIDSKFKIKDLGTLRFFLGLEVARSSSGLFLNQRKYALELINEAGLLGCKPSSLPMDTKQKLSLSTSAVLADPTKYRRLVGQLIYLTVTRPDLAFSVHVLSQYMHQPRDDHLKAAHKVLRYLKSAPAQGLFYPSNQKLILRGYCDADWGACPLTRRSVTGYSVTLGNCLISWKTKKQTVVSRSSAEAEYRAMAQASCELVWLTRLLKDFRVDIPLPIPLYCDNNAALHIARNPVFHERTKHVELDCHVVRQHVASGFLTPQYIQSSAQLADLFTKPLPGELLTELCSKLNVSNFLHRLSLRGDIEAPTPRSLDPGHLNRVLLHVSAADDHIEVKLVLLLPVDHPIVLSFDEGEGCDEMQPLAMDSEIAPAILTSNPVSCFVEMPSTDWRESADNWFGVCCCSFGGVSEKLVTGYANLYSCAMGKCLVNSTSVVICKDDLLGCLVVGGKSNGKGECDVDGTFDRKRNSLYEVDLSAGSKHLNADRLLTEEIHTDCSSITSEDCSVGEGLNENFTPDQKFLLNGLLENIFMIRSSHLSKFVEWNEIPCPKCSILLGAYPSSVGSSGPLDGGIRFFKCCISTCSQPNGPSNVFRKYTLERMFTSQLLECAKDELMFRTLVRDLNSKAPALQIVYEKLGKRKNDADEVHMFAEQIRALIDLCLTWEGLHYHRHVPTCRVYLE
ncbi:unnamed protein product [Rhodiola kirilowii]